MAPSTSDAGALYERYGPALVRKAQRILRNGDDAQDVVHALFVDLMGKRSLRGVDLPYLYRAVGNRCLNMIRDRKNRDRLLAAHDDALRGPVRTLCGDRLIDLDLLCRLTRRLDRKSLEVVLFHYFDDMTQEETAAMLGVSRRAVVKRLQKIRAAVDSLAEEVAA